MLRNFNHLSVKGEMDILGEIDVLVLALYGEIAVIEAVHDVGKIGCFRLQVVTYSDCLVDGEMGWMPRIETQCVDNQHINSTQQIL